MKRDLSVVRRRSRRLFDNLGIEAVIIKRTTTTTTTASNGTRHDVRMIKTETEKKLSKDYTRSA